ncbi:hypothetical protein GOODEAATRI_009784, partial [Goodea atripinnis]
EMRNDLYMTLEKGEFEKGGKSVARNVEITVYVLDADGQILKGYVAAGSGEPGADEYHSLVLYHNNSPRWAEQIKLPIPVDMFRGSHVRFEFRHCSSDMLDLLKWRAHPERINDSLSKLKEIDGSEIVKVHIINLLQDSKFQHFKPVMDTYIESHFAGALSYRDLMKVLKWYMDRIVEAEHQDHIQQVLKASEYIFKYIIQSRRLFSLATGGQNEEEFRACIHELFMSICFFLSQENKGISPVAQTQHSSSPNAQAVFLRTFPAIYSELLKFFTVREVAGFVRETLASLPTVVQADSPLEAVKLQCISKTEPAVSEEVELIVESLLGVLLRTILEISNRPQPAGPAMRLQFQDGEFVACLLALLRHMSDKHYQKLLQAFSSKDDLRDFLLHIFTVFRILIRPEMFPKDWTVMRLVTNKYGDMRVMMGCEIFSMWQNLGEHKLNFIPAMIGPFLEVTLVPQPDLRNVMIPIFHDMMDWEQRRSGNFKQVGLC